MPNNTPIYSYHEKDVLLHVLFEDYPDAGKRMEELIKDFEQTDFKENLGKDGSGEKKLIDIFLKDKEAQFAPLKPFYHGMGFSESGRSRQENALIEAGVFYTIAKLLLINYHYRKGLNKLMYASSLPKLPDKFKPLFLFRLGSIYLEQGMMVEARDTLALTRQCYYEYDSDQIMQKLEELILYQMLRVYVIQEEFTKAKEIIDTLKTLVKKKDNIIFLALQGYYHRRKHEYKKAFKILNKVYAQYKDNEGDRNKFSRRWFDILYQLSYCCLESGQVAKAEVFSQELQNTFSKTVLRNLGYFKQLQGQIETNKKGGDLNTARNHFQDAFHIFENYNDYRCMAWSMMNIGHVYFKLKDFSEARRCYNQSLVYNYRTHISVHILRTLLAKIDLSLELFQYSKVEEYLTRIDELDIPQNHHSLSRVAEYKKILKDKQTPAKSTMGNSETIEKIKEKAFVYSKFPDPILITGESGVGKSMLAKIIHKDSGRQGRFEHVYCTNISATLIESELFGHVKGAFSGALKDHTGFFAKANGGTLFLDEIGDLSPELQGKLFRFLDENTILRVGDEEGIKLNVRVICATNRDLEKELLEKKFREDLYYRVNKLSLNIPPLRERPEDIKKLTEHFYVKHCTEHKKQQAGIEVDALNYILNYPWPGNVRELEATINKSIIELEDGQELSNECLKKSMISQKQVADEKTQKELRGEFIRLSDSHDSLAILFKDLQKRVEELEAKQATVPGRVSDKHKMLNNLFLIIQEKQSIRRAQITERDSHLKKSFHHWINILRDQYQVIEVEKIQNYHLYKPVSVPILEAKEREGKLIKGDGSYYQLA